MFKFYVKEQNMKTATRLFLAILVSLFACFGNCYAKTTEYTENFYLESSSTNPVLGEEFWISLLVKPTNKDLENIAVFRLKLNFDSSLLKYTGIYSEHGTDDFKISQNQNSLTIIFLTGEKGIKLEAGIENTLAEINFKVLSNAKEGSSKISAQIDGVADYEVKRIIPAKSVLNTTVNVEKGPTPDCNLKYLSTENYTLYPVFSENVTRYSTSVPSEKSSLEVTAKPNDPNAKVTINRKTLNAAGKSTDIKVTVTSANKKSKKVYNISVNRLSKLKSAKGAGNKNNQSSKGSSESKKVSQSNNSSSKINIEKNHFDLALFLVVTLVCIFLGILILKSKTGKN